MLGILACGAYVPRRRLQREAIAAANTWFDASLAAHARGERSMCNWDEDAVTMAVEAGRDAGLAGDLDGLVLASTSFPFQDRQNAGIAAEALGLGAALRTLDIGGSQRAGTSALMTALDLARGAGRWAVIASEHRRARVGSAAEMLWGDGAAALVLGEADAGRPLLARYLGGHTVSRDFVDHFRGDGAEFDYDWEERWIRDEGFLKVVPEAVGALLARLGVEPAGVDRLVVAAAQRRVPAAVAKRLGIAPERVVDTLADTCGHTGVAHALVLLAAALESAAPGERILVTGFGQGCDALLFEATDALAGARPALGVSGHLARREVEDNYARYQTFNRLVAREYGKRAEVDRAPNLSAYHRNRATVTAFVGGRCRICGCVQFPKAHYCVNPQCGAGDSQDDHPMSHLTGRVQTWTADRLTFDMNPPAYFGLVSFEGGGRAMLDFTEVRPEAFDVGTEVRLHFRIKHLDAGRGYRSYFWKAAPL